MSAPGSHRADVANLLEGFGAGPVLVHSDVVGVVHLVPLSRSRKKTLEAHARMLRQIVNGRELWFPTFNYDFTRSRAYDVSSDRCQVGVLGEYARRHLADWRTPTPVFHFSGSGPDPFPVARLERQVDPFDATSPFGELVRLDGTLLCYGADVSSLTIIHHVERLSGGPLYRFDKVFPGVVRLVDGEEREVELFYHVRPLDRHFGFSGTMYDATVSHLLAEGEGRQIHEPGVQLLAIRARALVEYWLERVREDPFYLVDESTRAWAVPLVERLGRRVRLEDFETV